MEGGRKERAKGQEDGGGGKIMYNFVMCIKVYVSTLIDIVLKDYNTSFLYNY